MKKYLRPEFKSIKRILPAFKDNINKNNYKYMIAKHSDKTEKQPEDSEKQFQSILEDLTVGILIHQNFKIVYANKKIIEILEAEDKSSLLNHSISEFIPKENFNQVLKLIKIILKGSKHTVPYETQYLSCRKKIIDAEVIAIPVKFKSKKAILISGSDISKRKKTEKELANYREHLEGIIKIRTKELRKKNTELKQANSDLESFSYTISHDLKVPLRAVSLYANKLSEVLSEENKKQAEQYIRQIDENIKNMNLMIDDLIKFAKLGKKELFLQNINLSQLVKDIYANIIESIPNHNTKLEVKNNLFINADITGMKHVIYNLLSNAVKFSDTDKPNKIIFGKVQKNNEETFFIKDHGIGFNIEHHDEIFLTFKRLHKNDKYKGSGIGLAAVKKIIEKHGGKIYAESKIGKGSTFFFTLKNE